MDVAAGNIARHFPALTPYVDEVMSQILLAKVTTTRKESRVQKIASKFNPRPVLFDPSFFTRRMVTDPANFPLLGSLQDWSFKEQEGVKVITVGALRSSEDSSDFRDLELIAMSHEFFHAVIQHIWSANAKELESFMRESDTDLLTVIHECMTIALEYVLLNDEQTQFVSDEAATFGAERMSYIRQSARAAAKLRKEKNGSMQLFSELAYTEGAKLAIALKRNGWTLNDLPLFFEQITTIIRAEIKASDHPSLASILITKDKSPSGAQEYSKQLSSYTKIMTKIRSLKKET